MARRFNGTLRPRSRTRAWLARLLAGKHSGAVAITGNVCISMVKNEQDIIEPFVRHNAKFFDAMVILDNGSTDRTREILMQLSRELGTLIIVDLPDRRHEQSRFMSQALRNVQAAFFADAVCFLDADEFIGAASRETFDAAVARIPLGWQGLMPWRTYLPDPSMNETAAPDPLSRMHQRRAQETPGYNKVILRLGGQLDPELLVQQGNHLMRNWALRRLNSIELPELPLLHFPVRSVAQMTAKGVIGWLANQARGNGAATDAYQWRRIHDLVASGNIAQTAAELADEAMAYAQTPRPAAAGSFAANAVQQAHGIDLHRAYSDGRFGNADALIAAAQLAQPMACQTFQLPTPPARAATHTMAPSKPKPPTDIENAFDGAWHWDHLFLDASPIQFLIEKFQPRSVMDVGCGNGAYPLLYQFHGISDVLGLDGIDEKNTVLAADQYRKVDLQTPYDAGRRFDLVVCLEVVEHLRPNTTTILFDTIERHAKDLILFSMAEPGQPGNGHINCLPMEEVLRLWAQRGWQPDLLATLGARAISTMSWFRRNIVVLRRTGDTSQSPAAQKLCQIAAWRYKWYGQAPGIRLAAFKEDYPDVRFGYGLRML